MEICWIQNSNFSSPYLEDMSMYIQFVSKSNGLRDLAIDFKGVDAIETRREEFVKGCRVERWGQMGA